MKEMTKNKHTKTAPHTTNPSKEHMVEPDNSSNDLLNGSGSHYQKTAR
jgi:hypothetical protein